MKNIFLAVSVLILSNIAIGQQKQQFIQGFTEAISGQGFGYHSPLPEVNTSLLIRGMKIYEDIEWKTEIVPLDYNSKYISFIWLFGMDVSSSPADFHLFVNNSQVLSFSNSKISSTGDIVYKGKNNVELVLKVSMLDKYDDQMGFAILKIPTKMVNMGESVKLKISTTSDNNTAWFMTFKAKIEENVKVYQNNVVAKQDGQLFHSVSVDFTHIGKDAKAIINIEDHITETILKTGFNKIEIYLPKVLKDTSLTADIRIEGKKNIKKSFTLKPVREWEIFLVQHTHTDIGYTRPQTEILAEHLRYIDNALDFCDQTDDYPDDAKFRWTCETSWSVREYLKSRPQSQIDRLLRRLKEGRIEATGMFLNYSEIVDANALAAQTKTLKFLKDKGIDVTTAMQNDVNGIGWCMIDYYKNTDVKYLTMGIHAHRARKPFNKPTSFWWESPAENRLLAYRSEHYQYANTLGITGNQQDVLRNNLSKYLKSLEEKNYPYDKVSLQFSGYITDNSPPSTTVCNIIKEWNEKYEWPRLRSSLARDFMIYLDEQHADDLKVKKVAWPDWWTDGVASALNETKTVRQTQSNITAITSLFSLGIMNGVEVNNNILNEIQLVYDNILFYDEHTYGAAESVSDPLAENTVNQWAMKSSYAWEASKKSHLLEEKALGLLEQVLVRGDKPTIAIFNTLNWSRSGIVDLFLQNSIVQEGYDFTITDENGKEVPYQRKKQRQEGAYFELWIDDVPPMGFKTFMVNTGTKPKIIDQVISNNIIENQYYKLTIDTCKGIVSHLIDKELNIELVDENDSLTLGQIVYEQLGNRHQMERLTSSNRDTIYKPLDMSRAVMQNIKLIKTENGAIYTSVFLNGKLPVCADERGVDIEIRLYNSQKKIDLLYSMVKLPVTTAESVYIAFPFKLDSGKFAFDVQGGVVEPGINQLEGSSSDWNTVQNFASVRNSRYQILLTSEEIPLVQFGDINTGRYYYRLRPETNHIFSWVLNNYWVTNFKANQSGELKWRYSINSVDNNSNVYATKYGYEQRVPLKSRILMPDTDAKNTVLNSQSFLNINVDNLLLINASPSLDGKGIILHLRELNGDHAVLDIKRIMEETGSISAYEVNALEEEMKVLSAPVLIEHYENKFIKLNFIQ